jgi:PAT family beta-lactamase induction signal transducer AmpG
MISSRLIAVLFLGLSSGLPLGLTGSTLQAWMKTEGVDLSVIGLFSLVGMPYALKFLWAPVMDRYVPPFLGRRRGWLLVTQAALVASIVAMAFSSPREHLFVTALLALMTAFFSASHDIVNDAYRADVLEPTELGMGSSLYVTGYRVAMILSGGVALILADHLPWRAVYLIMAAAMGIGVVTTLLAPEPAVPAKTPKTLSEAVVQPFLEFFGRRGAFEIILFTVLYKLDAVLTVALTTPFMMELGFTKTDIGTVNKGFGLAATIVGTLLGGALMSRLGLKKSLWYFGGLQAIAGLSFLALSMAGHSYPWMVTAIAAENICSGLGNAAYAAFLLSQCNRSFSATQYALLSSLMAVTRNVLSAPAGFLASAMGWNAYYVFCVFASVPAFLLLLRYDRWQSGTSAGGAGTAAKG